MGLINAWVYEYRGLAHYYNGDNEKAVEDFNFAIELDPLYATSYWGRAQAYQKMGQLEAALSDLQDFVALNPDHNNPSVFETIAEIEAQLNR